MGRKTYVDGDVTFRPPTTPAEVGDVGKIKTYEPRQVRVKFGDVEFEGFADGTFIESERDVFQAPEPGVAVDGKYSGTIEVTLLAEGPNNDALFAEVHHAHQEMLLDEVSEMIEDGSAWVTKMPALQPAPGVKTREWVFSSMNYDQGEMRIHAEILRQGRRLDRRARRKKRLRLWKKRGRR